MFRLLPSGLLQLLLLFLLLLLLFPLGAQPQTEEPPNIIFILTDDQRYDALGYAGNQLIHTPAMDALAATGTYFSHAMVTTPICAASRASLLSGVYERTHRYNFQTGDLRAAHLVSAYPRLLRSAGYHTGFFGKFGVRYQHQQELFDEFESYDRNGAYPDRRGYFYKTIQGDTVHLTRYTGQQGLDFIDKNAKRKKPFYLTLNFSAPHAHDNAPDQYFWQQTTDSLLARTTIPAPALGAQKYFDLLPRPVREGFNRLRWTWRYDTPEKYQHSVKGYYRMLAGIDLELEKIRKKLTEKGIADNTVIILMGDNGYFLGERQLAGKWLMYDNAVRVPLIIFDPRAKHAVNSDVLALNIDVPATILDLARVAQPPFYQGKSLVPIVHGAVNDLARDTVLIEHIWDFKSIPPSEGVRTRDWKYFRYVDDQAAEELYFLTDDPQEIHNLAGIPRYDKTLLALRRKCDELIKSYTDTFAAPPQQLSVEFLREPAGIPLRDAEPEFAWEVPAGTGFQAAYQLLVAESSEALAQNRGTVWDSGKIISTQSTNIVYQGPPLLAQQQYYWKVRIWDDVNRLTGYSQPQAFMGAAAGAGQADEKAYLSTPNRFQMERVNPIRLEQRGKTWFADFGRAGFASLAFTYTSPAERVLTVRLGELLGEDGRINAQPGGSIRYQEVAVPVKKGKQTIHLSLPPNERNTQPLAAPLPDSVPVLLPFRYVEIDGVAGPLTTDQLTQLVYHTYWDDNTSYFSSDNDLLNQVWELCRYSIKATSFAGLYVDGDRERIPYEADAYLNQLSHYTTDREYAIGRRTIEYFMSYPTWPTEWQLHVALMFWADYQYTGNTELITRYYEALKHKTLLELVGEDGLISSSRATPEFMKKLGFGEREEVLRDITDWPPARKDTGWPIAREAGERDGFVFRPNNTIVNALYFRNMEIMAAFARLLDKEEEAVDFQIRALRAKQSINDKMLDRERGVYVDGEGTDHASLHANMFALAFGVVPPAYRSSVGAFIKRRGMACSVYGAQYLLEGLYAAGMEDYALHLMTDTIGDRNWYNMIRFGSTITMEAWALRHKPNLDLNHAWGAAPANIIPRYLWGIQPQTPGFGIASIRPRLGSLRETEIRVPTLRGPIRARYRFHTPRYEVYIIDLPGNMAAEFSVPLADNQTISLNGKQANLAFGAIRLAPGRNRLEIKRNSF